jgi:hypothetical protein
MQQEFQSAIQKLGSRVGILIPFDPNQVWGQKERHDIHGTINGQRIRGKLEMQPEGYVLSLGPTWRRGCNIDVDAQVTVVIEPEGPHLGNLAEDVATALTGAPAALIFFNSLPTFYRKNYLRWIESAKRPETRAARIVEMTALLEAGQREK